MVGESQVILDKNIVPDQPRESFPTFAEWVSDGNAEIVIQSRLSGAADTLYTVPDNFTLFITSAFVTAMCNTGAPSQRSALLIIGNREENGTIISTSIVGGNTSTTATLSFPMPIKINSKEQVRGILNVGLDARWGFQGFLLTKKISIR